MLECQICHNVEGNENFVVREMMYGMDETFNYIKCSHCGCLQLKSVPPDLSKYYPSNYYSFKTQKTNQIKFLLERFKYYFYLKKLDFSLKKLGIKRYERPAFIKWIHRTNTARNDAIIDIGCGGGSLLKKFAKAGFQDLTGIDPFIEKDIEEDRVKILKKSIFDSETTYDLAIMHHSFEHMFDPLAVLQQTYKILNPQGYAIVAVPLIGYAWRKYGVDWVAIDAPRHLFIHTVASMKMLAEQAGFLVRDVVYDSHAFQFWGSEQIIRGIPVMSDRSYRCNPKNSIFSQEQMQLFFEKSEELNRQNDGDSACFYLYKA